MARRFFCETEISGCEATLVDAEAHHVRNVLRLDVVVDTSKSFNIYREWLKLTKPGPGPGGLRRPKWLGRPLRPTDDAYYV